jgi:hypothetical protein
MVMDCLLQINRISTGSHMVEQILKYLLKLCNRIGIITTMIVICAAFMVDNDFRQLCFRDELAAWSGFEVLVLTPMMKDKALIGFAMSLRDDILHQNDRGSKKS